ncbi:retrovirus-related pol polyprotein from transposon TNT 1-94 [Tanacetum coccineum]|uniref:Retrovirus-related pol polyprotein from transposon TNT 1-94 n=1 Tax=Tanacetum coccineum TaxID=301880 RepID=A0ABQ4YB16_9ASTR
MYTASLKRSESYKAQPYQYASPSKQILKAKAKPFPQCTHSGFNDHRPDDYRNYPECEIYGSYDHFTSRHNRRHIREPIWYLDNGCSRSMTGVKSYLHKYVGQPGLKVVFGDNSSCITEGYGSINCGAPRRNDVYVLDMSSLTPKEPASLLKPQKVIKHALHVKKENTKDLPSKLNKTSQSGNACIFFIWISLDLMVENQNDIKVKQIRTDNETEFRNTELESFCDEKGISQNFSSPYTPEQNGVAKKKNRTSLRLLEPWKFDAKADDGYFLGYSFNSKAFRVFNIRRQQIEETYHVTFDESIEAIRFTNTSVDEIGIDDSSRYPPDEFLQEDDPSRKYQIDSNISYYNIPHGCSLTELTQEKHVPEVIDPNEQDNPQTEDVKGSKWVFKNKKDEHGIITKNKARVVTQGYSQEKGIDYDETFAPVARMKDIRIFLAFATYMNFIVFQMDVKSAFMNGKLKEEVYVKQPPGFESSEFPDYVCKLDKALYGLKQAIKACSLVKTLMVPSNNLGPNLLISVQSKRIIPNSCEKNLQVPESGDQNFLREFWCTAIAHDPNPPTDDSEVRPLNEYLIKFLVMNGKKPLTLDFKTFAESTRLDYAKDTYVSHPSPEAVKAELAKIVENPLLLDRTPVLKTTLPVAWRILFTFVVQVLGRNYSFTEQLNLIQQIFFYCLLTRTKVDIGEIIYSDLVTRLTNKSRNIYVSYPRFISCALVVLLGPDYTQDESFGSSPTILSNSHFSKYLSKVTPIALMEFMVVVNNHEYSVNPLPFTIKKKKGKSQTVTPTLPQLQDPKASGSLSQKRKKPVSKKTPTETKADQTQSARLRYRSLTKNKGKTSSEVEPDTETLQLKKFVDVQAFLLSNDEMVQESNDDVLEAGEDMKEDTQADEEEHQSPLPN